MPKTAAELVPLKTQLRASMGLFRFNDATTDFFNPNTGQWIENDFNLSGYDPVLGRLAGTSNARPPEAAATPTNLAVNLTSTGELGRVGVQYVIMAYDASNRPSQAAAIWVQPPASIGTTGSATLSWAALPASASYIRVWGRQDWGNTHGGWTYVQLAGTATSLVIGNLYGTLGTNNTTTPPPYPDAASTAPRFPEIAVTYNTTGGSITPHVVSYRVSSYTALGETTPTAPVYVQPQGRPQVSASGRVLGVTPTLGYNSGALPAGVYYYVVTARTEFARNNYSTTNPWYGESLPSTEIIVDTGGATPATRVDLAWTQAEGNVGYYVYRGTATGELFYLGATGTNVNTFSDTGSLTPSATMRPPLTYNGAYVPGSGATLTWSAAANAAGYWVLRAGWNPDNTHWSAGYQVVGGATTSFTDTAAAATGRYSNSQNLSGIGGIRTAGHYFRPAQADQVMGIGFTIIPVSGQRYRIVVRSLSSNVQWDSGYQFTATTNAPTYFEYNPNAAFVAGQDYLAYIQAEGSAGAFSWPVVTVNMMDDPVRPMTHHHGQVVWGSANTNNSTVYGYGASSQGNQPTYVADRTAVGLPFRIVYRRFRTSAALVNPAGNLLGSDIDRQQIVLTNNQTYTVPIRSIIPTWNAVSPTSPKNQALMMATYLAIEVSTDGGSTWTRCTLDQRLYFQTPATQVMFRIIFPPRAWFQSFDQNLVNYPSATNTTAGAWRPGHQGSSSDFGAYWEFKDQYSNSNGWWPGIHAPYYVFSHNYNNLSSDLVYAYDSGADVDVRGEFWPEFGGGGEGGPRVRYNRTRAGNDTSGGYLLGLNNDGNAYLRNITTTTASTVIATATGCVLPNQWNTARMVASGDRLVCWVNNRQVFDVVDTTYPSVAANNSAGAGGRKTRVRNLSVAPLEPGAGWSDMSRAPRRFELDFLAVYLEV